MHLLSVNTSTARTIQIGRKQTETGIYKKPTPEPVMIGREGLVGDTIVKTQHHGGPDQAVYVYGALDYAWWSAQLGRTFDPGAFGENLTVDGLESSTFNIGDRLQIGTAVLEVAAARIPCDVFAARMGDPGWVKRFKEGRRPGLYCRVITPGWVRADLPVSVIPHVGETVSLLETFDLFYDPKADTERFRRALAAPVAIRCRAEYEERLSALTVDAHA